MDCKKQLMKIKRKKREKTLEVNKRCIPFEENEVFNLISIYGMPEIQNEFRKSKRHSLIYEKIATLHNEKQYSRTGKDVKTKIKNLKSEYIKKKPKSGGTPPDDFPFYSILHKLWSEKDIFNDELLDDSMANDNLSDNSSNEDSEDEVSSQNESDESDYSENNNKNSRVDKNQGQTCKKNNKKVHQPKVKKICRPPRKVKSDESRLVELLIKSNADDTKRLEQIDERQKRAEERDIALNASLKQFLDTQVSYMNFVMAQNKDSNSSSNIRAPDKHNKILKIDDLEYEMPLQKVTDFDRTDINSESQIINEEVLHKSTISNVSKEAKFSSKNKCSPKILSNEIFPQKINILQKSTIISGIHSTQVPILTKNKEPITFYNQPQVCNIKYKPAILKLKK